MVTQKKTKKKIKKIKAKKVIPKKNVKKQSKKIIKKADKKVNKQLTKKKIVKQIKKQSIKKATSNNIKQKKSKNTLKNKNNISKKNTTTIKTPNIKKREHKANNKQDTKNIITKNEETTNQISLQEIKAKIPTAIEILEYYNVTCDDVKALIVIYNVKNENVPLYKVFIPKLDECTKYVVENIIHELSYETNISISEITDVNKLFKLRNKFFKNALNKIKTYFPNLNQKEQKLISGLIVQEMYGFGDLDIIMSDDFLEEVCINRSDEPICVYHKHYGWVKTCTHVKDEEETYNYASMIGRKVGRDINGLNPIMDAHLVSGDRVAATLFPISSAGNTITFRRFSRSPWTITHLVSPKFGVMNYEIAALLWQAIEFELNVLVCGGTASGKTSVLNALSALLPKNQRIVSIEDTREFILPEDLNWNWIPMVSKKENIEGFGSISMLDLIVASLRMRPDRIIVGEVRTREQAETMFEAMHTGHSVCTTMHADTVEQMTRRLVEPPIAIPKNEVEALHLILVQHRDRQHNKRRTLEIGEILRGGRLDNDLSINYLYRWRPRTDTFEKIENSIRLLEDLNLRTGMTPSEIEEDLKKRENVLKWLVKNEIYDTNVIGKIMKVYYRNKNELFTAINKNSTLNEVIKNEE
ncbi:MAG: type II/IV secretion system ATPase subunit [Candidatus Woesearchaeota archaeon]